MVHDDCIASAVGQVVVEFGADHGRCRRGAGEELREVMVVKVDEDAGQRERDEVHDAAGVHDGAPGAVNAPCSGEVTRTKSTEDIGEQVGR